MFDLPLYLCMGKNLYNSLLSVNYEHNCDNLDDMQTSMSDYPNRIQTMTVYHWDTVCTSYKLNLIFFFFHKKWLDELFNWWERRIFKITLDCRSSHQSNRFRRKIWDCHCYHLRLQFLLLFGLIRWWFHHCKKKNLSLVCFFFYFLIFFEYVLIFVEHCFWDTKRGESVFE